VAALAMIWAMESLGMIWAMEALLRDDLGYK